MNKIFQGKILLLVGLAVIASAAFPQPAEAQVTNIPECNAGSFSGYGDEGSASNAAWNMNNQCGGVISCSYWDSGWGASVICYAQPTACTSAPNACGQTNSGTRWGNGACDASTPANPAYLGQSCSASNACGTNYGTYNCSQSCSASAPYVPPNYGQACNLTSAANACGQTTTAATGTYNCAAACTGTPPAAPSNAGCNAAPGAPEISFLYRGDTIAYVGAAGSAYFAPGYRIYMRATDPNGDNVAIYYELYNAQTGAVYAGNWSENPVWNASGGWTYTSSFSNFGPGTYYVRAAAMDPTGVWGPWTGWNSISLTVTTPADDLTVGASNVNTTYYSNSYGIAWRPFNFYVSATVTHSGPSTLYGIRNIFQLQNMATMQYTMINSDTLNLGPNITSGIAGGLFYMDPGSYQIRACTDTDPNWAGTIAESNESNNCGPWASFSLVQPTLSCSSSYTDADGTGSLTVGDTVNYSASPSNLGGSAYTWDPSESGTDITGGASLSRSYASSGTYEMRVSSTPYTSSICSVDVGTTCEPTPSGTLSLSHGRVKQGDTATVTWGNLTGVHTSCSITSSSGDDSAVPAPSAACEVSGGSRTTAAITTQTTYNLVCDGAVIDSAVIDVVPSFIEY